MNVKPASGWMTSQQVRNACPWLPPFTEKDMNRESDISGYEVLNRDTEHAQHDAVVVYGYVIHQWGELAKRQPDRIKGHDHPSVYFGVELYPWPEPPLLVDNDNDTISKF